MEKLIELCRHKNAEEILEDPDVRERVVRYFEQEKAYEKMILENSTARDNVLVIDLHNLDEILCGNRFKEYVLFPDINVSLRVIWGFRKQNMVFTVGHSIINRTCRSDIGSLMLKYEGGGHEQVGTCQVPTHSWENIRDEIVSVLRENG
jgi:nanoRNase/pAp phosphatase (c-di-AMP/oligoRNAs hydrolase)